MSDPHFELPAHPDLEYYRKQAKHLLRSYEAGDAAARERAAEVLGDRAAGRFLLSDAQFVLAQEHGFRTWADFRAGIQSQRTTGYRPVPHLWGGGFADPEQIMAEAFVHACQHGRTEVVRWFLDRGLNPDVAPYFGRTGLFWAVMSQQPEVAGLLLERGADPARRDELVPLGPQALVAIFLAANQNNLALRQLDQLLNSRSR
jgi:hypothetical protein